MVWSDRCRDESRSKKIDKRNKGGTRDFCYVAKERVYEID